MYSEILVNINTKKEAEELSDLVEDVSREIKGDLSKLTQTLPKYIKEPHNSAIISYMKEKSVEELSKLAVFLKEIEELKLTISFTPKKDHLEEIISWTKKNIGPEMVIKFETDETILGGAVLSFKGRYKDYSLRKILDVGGPTK